jgi:hypothetical protein
MAVLVHWVGNFATWALAISMATMLSSKQQKRVFIFLMGGLVQPFGNK